MTEESNKVNWESVGTLLPPQMILLGIRTAYLGGPMRRYPRFNCEAFTLGVALLRKGGLVVWSPLEADMKLDGFDPDTGKGIKRTPEGKPDIEAYMRRDLPAVREQDCIVLLPGWQQSEGTCRELREAYMAGHPAFELIFTIEGCELKWVDNGRTDVLAALTRAAIASGVKEPSPAYDELGHYDYPGPTGPDGKDEPGPIGHSGNGGIPGPVPGRPDEVRVVDPKTGAAKGQKLCRMDLLPSGPLMCVAEHYGKGSKKYSSDICFSVEELVKYLLANQPGDTTCAPASTIRIEKRMPADFVLPAIGANDSSGQKGAPRIPTVQVTLAGCADRVTRPGCAEPTMATTNDSSLTRGSGRDGILSACAKPGGDDGKIPHCVHGINSQNNVALCADVASRLSKPRFFWNGKEVAAEFAVNLFANAVGIWIMTIVQDGRAATYATAAIEDSVSWVTLWKVLSERGLISNSLQFLAYKNDRITLRQSGDRNWERGYKWSLSFGAMMRHAWQFWNGEDDDQETGSPHMAAVVFHALALMEFRSTHPELDDRPGRGEKKA